MNSGFRIGSMEDNDRERAGRRRAHDWCTLAVALLSITLMLVMVPAAIWSRPADLARAQGEHGASDLPLPGQVIAQGIARLPRGEVAWTVQGMDVSGEAGTAVESFPVGFAIADDATVALLDAEGEVLNILAADQAAFLPSGKSGALASWETDAASLYEVALVSVRDANAGETTGTIVGEPFAAPEGAAFDIELAQETLPPGEEATIPLSRSGVPVLFLQTAGSVQLEGGNGQIVELTEGQFAMLSGQVVARGVGDVTSTFVVAAIGEATAAREPAAAGTPEIRAGREERQQAREAAQGEDTSGIGGTREKRAKRVRTGGGGGGGQGGGQTAPQGTGSTGGGTGTVPITGGVDATVPAGAPVGTPGVAPTFEPTPAIDSTADETPTTDDSTLVGDETVAPEDEVPVDSTVTPEPIPTTEDAIPNEETTETPVPVVEAPPAEETVPIAEAPVEETVPAEPVIEEEVTDPATGA